MTVSSDMARVTIQQSPKKPADETIASCTRAVKRAEAGEYAQALSPLSTVVSEMPVLGDAWRNLGMALLESGRVAEAKETLYQSAHLYPHDGWCYLLLGNLYAKQERNLALAGRFYEKAPRPEPRDAYTIASRGGIRLPTGRRAKGRKLRARMTHQARPGAQQ